MGALFFALPPKMFVHVPGDANIHLMQHMDISQISKVRGDERRTTYLNESRSNALTPHISITRAHSQVWKLSPLLRFHPWEVEASLTVGRSLSFPPTCTSNRFQSKTKAAAHSPLPDRSWLPSPYPSITFWMQMGSGLLELKGETQCFFLSRF